MFYGRLPFLDGNQPFREDKVYAMFAFFPRVNRVKLHIFGGTPCSQCVKGLIDIMKLPLKFTRNMWKQNYVNVFFKNIWRSVASNPVA